MQRFIWLMVFSLVVGCAATPQDAEQTDPLDIARAVQPVLVRVEYTLCYDKGEAPRALGGAQHGRWYGGYYGGYRDAETLTKEERPLEAGGFLITPRKVFTEDPELEPRFIEKIEVCFDGDTVPARPSAWPTDRDGLILELDRQPEGAEPLEFDPAGEEPYFNVTYRFDDGVWTTRAVPVSKEAFLTERGRTYFYESPASLIVAGEGTPVGIAAVGQLPLDGSWKGSPLDWPALSQQEVNQCLDEIRQVCSTGVLRVRLNFRSPPNDESGGMSMFSSRVSFREEGEESETERHVTGVLLDERRVMVLAYLEPEVTGRLERITVFPADAGPVQAEFEHTLSDYGCFLATLKEPLTGAVGFAETDIRDYREQFMPAAEILIHGQQRVEHFHHSRFHSFSRGWRRHLFPQTHAGSSGIFVFDREGALVTLPLARRQKVSGEERYRREIQAELTPTVYVAGIFADLQNNIDPSNVPLSEEEEKRVAWLGVELQPLNRQLARVNNVSDLTNDGDTGALVAYVYPDSPAAEAGVTPGCILLRLHVKGYPAPVDVQVEDYSERLAGFPWDQFDQIPEQFFERIPMPWPPADNPFRRILTDIGMDKRYTADFFRDGEVVKESFQVVPAPQHYGTAPRYEFEAVGITVRDMTFEVRRHFHKTPNDPGVIVSKVERGSKASVAGIKPYEIVTHVNDEPVADVAEFEKLTKGREELRLSVLRMTQQRLVKIKVPEAEEEDEAAEQNEE